MQQNDLLEPLKVYKSVLKSLHHENSIKFFDELVKSNKVDEELNKETVKKHYAKLKEASNTDKKLKKKKAIKNFIIALAIIFFLAAVVGLILLIAFNSSVSLAISIPLLVGGLIIGIIICVFGFKDINKDINDLFSLKNKLIEEANNLKQEAYAQMAPLNASYDWNIPASLVSKTCPLFQMDKYLDTKKFEYLHEKYGLDSNTNVNQSTLAVQSGSILGNPFIIRENFVTEIVDYTYRGAITIHWTTTERTSNGYRTVSHSQVLEAFITKPKPIYYRDTWLIYGCDAAPHLTFSRKPTDKAKLDEKNIDKEAAKFDKKLDKMVQKSLTDDDPSTFTRMYNAEFEMLFNALNRDNDMEFRLLFTPLAQNNIMELVKDHDYGYGDDFYFYKYKYLNFVKAEHAQGFDITADPRRYINFDLEDARNNFVSYNDEYFKSFFFNFAPLLSIPLYQQTKTKEYIYKYDWPSNVTDYEHEVAANTFDSKHFLHPESVTPGILKTNFIKKDKTVDEVNVTCYSYKTIKHVDFVSVYGRDGHYHNVPVEWYEYIPLQKNSTILVQATNETNEQYSKNTNVDKLKSIFKRGILATLISPSK
ncbi:MAG: MAG1210 family protein [Bacilli bacterium]